VTFYTGTHEPSWLRKTAHPLFLSRRRLARLKSLPLAQGTWALDSGGFSELSMFGEWRTEAARYADEVALWSESITGMQWAAVQDWMCEPFILAKTGKTIAEHQSRTVESYIDLHRLAPSLPWAPVLQGWEIDDYFSHARQYEASGIDLRRAPAVGVGSVCRRQGSREIVDLFDALSSLGLKLHGFGLKFSAIKSGIRLIESADSMAWSYRARKLPPLPGCTHKSCANCFRFAMRWRDQLFSYYSNKRQDRLALGFD
jgi:hypothetical protein